MDWFNYFVSILDRTLATSRRRHIVGGVLLSVSALFGGLAVTAMTLKPEDSEEEDCSEYEE